MSPNSAQNDSVSIPTGEPIWPTTWAVVQPEDAGALSPLPTIWVVARTGRGKSSFLASIPGSAWVCDTENSWSTLQFQRPHTTVKNLRTLGDKFNKPKFQHNMFLAFLEELDKVRPGQYDVGGIDTFSDLQFGAFYAMPDHASIFGKSASNYNGREGTIFQWADSYLWWENILIEMSKKFQTTVLLSHPKDEFDKNSKARTGREVARGAEVINKVSLKLWLYDERDPAPKKDEPRGRWAMVEKSRLTWLAQEPGSKFPRMRNIMPKVLKPTFEGQSFPELIYNYLNQPSPTGYGTLDVVEGDPTAVQHTEEELRQRQLQEAELQREQALAQAKRDMFLRLVKDGAIADQDTLVRTLIELDLTEDVQHVEKMPAVEKAIRAHVAEQLKQPAGDIPF